MSEIRIRRAHNLPLEQARALAEQIARRLRDEFDLDYRWRGSALAFRRDGVEGTLTVSAAEIRLQARLGFLLSFLKPHIEQEIESHLDQLFAQAARRPRRKRT
jgi:putative polyhydroxyalkanoate system protein